MAKKPKYKTIKGPVGQLLYDPLGYGWVQVDFLIGFDKAFGIEEGGIYKVVAVDGGDVTILTPKSVHDENRRAMIDGQYRWISVSADFNPSEDSLELKSGDRVMLGEDYMRLKKGVVLKVKDVKEDREGVLVRVKCPSDEFWVYSHRLVKF